jgi:Bacterial membrane protein YfhO
MSVTSESTPPVVASGHQSDGSTTRDDERGHRLAVVVTAVAVMVFVVGTIGPPLVGRGVFLAADMIYDTYPWRALESPGALDIQHHGPTSDTVDAAYPIRSTFGEAARSGDFLAWDPLVAGGSAVGSESSAGVLGPFGWLFTLLPSWYAPAAVKLAVMAAAIGFTYLFCRRVGTGRVVALFGGMAFAGSGFMVMWTNWQHQDVAALIPAAFWATERFLQRPGLREAVPISLAIAALLLGGFPAVVGFTFYVLAGYVVVRTIASRGEPVRRRVVVAGGTTASVVAGVLLVSGVLLPFAAHLGDLDLSSREETTDRHLGAASLVTTVAPTALGLSTEGPDRAYFGPENQVETISFVGITTGLAAVVALCLAAPRRMPPGVRGALAAATVGLGVATYGGGVPLQVLQQLPVFSDNFIGRTRSILGFCVAVLAALGLQAVLERRSPEGRRGRLVAWLVGASAIVVAGVAVYRALDLARSVQRADAVWAGLVLPLVVGVAAVGLLALVRFGRMPLRVSALGGLAALLVVESLRLSLPLLPNEDRAHLYPSSPGIEFLQENLGAERVAPEGFALSGTAATVYGIRTVGGHAFFADTWKQALLAADPGAFGRSDTYATLAGDAEVVSSSVLDRLGVRWFAASGGHVPPGRVEDHGLDGASCAEPVPLSSVQTVTVPIGDGLRGLVVQPCGTTPLTTGSSIETTVRAGGESAEGRRRFTGAVSSAEALTLAAPADGLGGEGEARVTLRLDGAGGQSLPLAATPSGELAFEVIRPSDDGLRLAFADDLRIYERTAALSRVRWASRATVIEDAERRLSALSGGTVGDDTVVLSEPVGGDSGGGASDGNGDDRGATSITVTNDGRTSLGVTVDADESGHLVIADAMQNDWVATVDGEPAELVAADHAGVAVAVPEGRHRVELHYRPRGQRAGVAVSAATAVGLAAGVVAATLLRRRGGVPKRRDPRWPPLQLGDRDRSRGRDA